MAFRDRLRLPILGQTPAPDTDPLAATFGHTPPDTDIPPEPRIGEPPLGASGRANFWGLPEPDEINRRLIGTEGLRRFDEMYRTDPHIRRLVLMAWAPIIAGTWAIEPHGGDEATDLDREIADTVWWALNVNMRPNLLEHLATVGPVLIRSGFTPFEQIWAPCEREGKQYMMPRKLDLRLPRSVWRWWQDDYGELTYIGQILPNRSDVVIPASELVYYRIAPEGDNWQGTSLLRYCYKPWYLKDKLERIDAIGQERKAVGMPVIYPPKGADSATKKQVENLFAYLHTSEAAYAMMPGPKAGTQGTHGVAQDEWTVDVIQFDSSSGEGIQKSLEYHQRAIESSFAQDFMALGQHQVGARATAEVQEDPYLAAVRGLALTTVVPPLERLIERIVEVNWGAKAPGVPTLSLSLAESSSLSEIATYVQSLAAAEALTPDPELEDYLREHADLPPINKAYRDAREKAQLAGFEQAANPPDPLELAKAKAQGPPKPGADASANPTKPAAAGKPGKGKQLDASSPPPNLRDSDGDESEQPEHECGTCRMFDAGHCWGYGNWPVRDEWVCDSWQLSENWQAQDAAADASHAGSGALTLDAEPTARWFDRLLSQDRLREAMDGARAHIEASVGPEARKTARNLAHQAANGTPMTAPTPPQGLVDALTGHYEDMYHLGHQTVSDELSRQRSVLGRTLDTPGDLAGIEGSRLARARRRGEHSARQILHKITERLGRDQISGLKDPAALQRGAEAAALGQLHMEALASTAASINDGRNDAGMSAGDVAGAIYTAVMDERSCEACVAADTGDMLTPDEAVGLGPPNPDCEGSDRCRCTLVWVLSGDPAALAAAF